MYVHLYVGMNTEKAWKDASQPVKPGFIKEMVVKGCSQELNKIWYIYATQYYAAVIKNKMGLCVCMYPYGKISQCYNVSGKSH